MPTVRPRDVIAEINKLFPFGVPGTFPLDGTTIGPVRSILKLVRRIPVDLRPKGSNDQLLSDAIAVIRAGLQKAESEQPQVPLVCGIQAHNWENPVSILIRILGWCQNFRPSEVRRKLLELVAQHERSTRDPVFNDYLALGSAIDSSLSLDEIRRQIKILKEDGFVELVESESWAIRLTSSGWKHVDEPAEPSDGNDGKIFISCGQFTNEEKVLGYALADAVNALTPYQGFFAQNESSLDGLAKNIFHALRDCVGLVAVMHHRGTVKTPQGQQVRGSVWIEQEIAIAAFLSEVEGRDMRVVLYLQDGISLEGVRQQLHLNPVMFTKDEEVLRDFRGRIQNLFPLDRGISASV